MNFDSLTRFSRNIADEFIKGKPTEQLAIIADVGSIFGIPVAIITFLIGNVLILKIGLWLFFLLLIIALFWNVVVLILERYDSSVMSEPAKAYPFLQNSFFWNEPILVSKQLKSYEDFVKYLSDKNASGYTGSDIIKNQMKAEFKGHLVFSCILIGFFIFLSWAVYYIPALRGCSG